MGNSGWVWLAGLVAGVTAPAFASVNISSVSASLQAPQVIGTAITFTVMAGDSNSGPLAFQYSVAVPQQASALAQDFNPGTNSQGTWSSNFTWVPARVEGTYQIKIVAKDFGSGESSSLTVPYQITALATGSTPVATATANPLVAMFSTASCPAGSSMRVTFQDAAGKYPATATNYQNCHPPGTMNFEIAGMYASTKYSMFAQTNTGGKITSGPAVSFTTAALPGNLTFPSYMVVTPHTSQTDQNDRIVLVNPIPFGATATYPQVASDLSGRILWYYAPAPLQPIVLTRPLANGTILTIQNGASWYPKQTKYQFLRQVDLAGYVIKETNVGAIAQQLRALGAADANLCTSIASPAPVGSSCIGSFHHDAIQSLPNGDTALFAAVEKIFPAGTQGSTSPYPVDIIGDFIVVLDSNWQVKWYFDTFQHAGGAPQLDINRPATLGETCSANEQGCPPVFLLGSGIAPAAFDWLHANSIYYWPQDHALVWSSRDQDWIMKVNYQDGAGNGNIVWRLGLGGDFNFNNIYNDAYPWFSHQHDAGMENNGAGPFTVFDNGNTRIASNPDGHSRCMGLSIDETAMQATPSFSQDVGYYSSANGSAQLLPNSDYYCFVGVVLLNLNTEVSYSIEYGPAVGDTGTANFDLQGPDGYRAWRMANLYTPPAT